MARVSVVIPTYNRPSYLDGAISTVLDQKFDDIELIVVDDGSDKPYAAETVASYPDTVRCLRHTENRGLSAARNTGIEAASGEYVAFLDDDDRWHPTKLSKQVATLENRPRAGLATCLLVAVTPGQDPVRCERSKPDGDLSDLLLTRNAIGSPSRILVDVDVFDDIGTFDESFPTKQDWDFYIRLAQNWRVACVEEHLCRRTIHSSMSSDPEDARDDNMRVIEKHRDLMRERGVFDEALAYYHFKVGRTYLEDGEVATAREYLRRALDDDRRLQYFAVYAMTFLGKTPFEYVLRLKRYVEKCMYCDDIDITS